MKDIKIDKSIAELLFKGDLPDISFYQNKYKKRDLPEGAKVTRFAPSPTGFVHIGGIFNSLISHRLAVQSRGVFFLRIEDTDKKRELEKSIGGIVSSLKDFGIEIQEGVTGEDSEMGSYGPYKQSERKEIYEAFIRHLVKKGFAYPCFCSPETLEEMRNKQEAEKIRPGYYGKWAVHREAPPEEIGALLKEGKPYAIRLKSAGDVKNKSKFIDIMKGEIDVPENDQDIVLVKSDGLPTYHFAHVVDDYLMKTTHVVRGDEWLPSLPVHLEIFKMFGFTPPLYGHNPPILKLDAGSKRKLSKRKDPEAAVSYYTEQGYPKDAVIEYLLNIANSNFEDWRKANPSKSNMEFEIHLDKVNKSGAIFDIIKIMDISKNIIAAMTADEVYGHALAWAKEYDADLAGRMAKNADYMKKIFAIERGGAFQRKDIAKWSDVRDSVHYFFNDLFEDFVSKNTLPFPENIPKNDTRAVLLDYAAEYREMPSKDEWFNSLKDFGEKHGFAKDQKAYKAAPQNFKGSISDLAMIIRVALTGRTKAPDMHEIMRTIGAGTVKQRLELSAGKIKP